MSTTREARFMNPPHYGRDCVASPRPKYPLGNFLNTHIDENLVLRRIVLHHPLLTALANIVDAKLGGFSKHHLIPDDFFGRPQDWYQSSDNVNSAEPIAMTQQLSAGFVGSQLASTIYIHPEQPELLTSLSWGYSPLDTCDQNSSNVFLVEHVFLRFANYCVMEPHYLQQFHPEMQPKMLDIGKKYHHCATAMFFCPAAHELLRKMDRVATANSTIATPSSAPRVPRPPDNPHPLWTLSKLDAAPSRDDHIRRSSRTNSPVVDHCSPGRVKSFGKEKWRDNPAPYIQRAWAIANPAYGKIWADMHIAIAQDLMKHYQLRLVLQLVPLLTPGLKRASLDLEEGSNKKRKRTMSAKSGGKACATTFLLEEILIMFRGLAQQLVRQNSKGRQLQAAKRISKPRSLNTLQSPSTFDLGYITLQHLRFFCNPGKSAGQPILPLVISRATGDVFAATIPNVKHGPIVVKLATTFSRLCRLRHKYSVYVYLKSANVKCIPRVYGFYQDAHRSAGALILSNDGGPLGGRRAKLTADEKTRIRAAVSSIHAAGVLHHNLRTWNILVNDVGGISIIDFDRANTDAQDEDIQVEWERLEKLLKGKHVQNGQIIAKDGMPANIGKLVNNNPDA
ncbi:hypothetical protein CPB85DRAFT_1260759 [Mucidula mucida]|nr:hypothetical protein CPB85DRAFT_1260759 [Mucidula mucida]